MENSDNVISTNTTIYQQATIKLKLKQIHNDKITSSKFGKDKAIISTAFKQKWKANQKLKDLIFRYLH